MAFVIDFTDSQIQTFAVPLVVSAIAVGLLRYLMGPWMGVLLGSLGIAIGFLASLLLVQGFPGWPPANALAMLPYIILAGMVAGALVDQADNPIGLVRPLYIGLPMVIIFWLGVTFYSAFRDITGTVPYALLMIAGIIALQRLHDDRDDGIASPVALLAALAGLAVVGLVSGTSLARFPIAAAMAILGFLLWNWPRCRFPWSTAGTLSIGGTYLALIAFIFLQDRSMAIPLVISFAVFFVHPLTERVFMPEPRMSAVVQLVVSLVPIGLAGAAANYLV
ncbi:MAG: hypothetical protein IID51_13590 [Proteobacteria bacterium]|nr:hypothetical protein [Pseudomonadota bacterium]